MASLSLHQLSVRLKMHVDGLLPRTQLFVSSQGDEWYHERVVLPTPDVASIVVATPPWGVYQEQVEEYASLVFLGSWWFDL